MGTWKTERAIDCMWLSYLAISQDDEIVEYIRIATINLSTVIVKENDHQYDST